MAVWKLDLVFEAQGRGWQETYYADFGVPSFEEVRPIAQNLANKRILLAAPPVAIKAFRVSDPLTAGKQGRVFYYNPPAVAVANVIYPTGATDPSTAVNVGMSRLIDNSTRRVQMRGCPDAIFENFGTLQGTPLATWNQAFVQYRAFLLGQPRFGWLNRPTLADPAPVSYSLAVDPIMPVFTTPANFFAIEDEGKVRYVRMRGFNGGSSKANGEMIVRVLTRNTFTPMKPIALGPMIAAGIVQRYGPLAFRTADDVFVEKAGTRAPGAPLLQTPGRRRGSSRI